MALTEAVISEAYQKLSKARFDHWQSHERLLRRRAEFQKARANCIADGQLEGRNETIREAQARQLLPDQFAAIELAEIEERQAAIGVELCRIEIERVQALIRYLSLNAELAT